MTNPRRTSPHPTPSRRNLLRGGAALAVGAGLVTASAVPALARPRSASKAAAYPELEWIPASPSNYTVSNRPSEYPINYVVIHVTQGKYDGTISWFQNPSAQVSAHYVVRSEDGHIAHMVDEKDVGWHAGNWDYNTRSVGIEHEGFIDDPAWFTDAMYEQSALLTKAICDNHGIPKTREHVIAHHEVPGADHTDPGPHWDWDRYMQLVNA
ncbi:N-acetylmuramoyl-L-alanine amidase [Streptomyces sp. AJS327]|uniref:N-acetylmuramoyl-L-alanine amidase n=1 Tax=Streptomyces sp. AJS327 TaxID=2545265 RepID=UPI0015DD9D2D|nr:N-acetylmuramoyl-L-alanine amidase [Streptomyces sp. AJS327]MBA0052424.1 N-acetylmuramoyl-L-alanine amidase [Streptomyces sp. AJS327]